MRVRDWWVGDERLVWGVEGVEKCFLFLFFLMDCIKPAAAFRLTAHESRPARGHA